MPDDKIITTKTSVTFNIDEQKLVADLETSMSFSDFVHSALSEKIDRERLLRKALAPRGAE